MIPDIAVFHPQIVHFVVSLLFVGVLFRLVALTGKFSFTNPTAKVLLLVGTVAAVLAAMSGTDAHGTVERIPGARPAVVEHEEWGERARNVFLVVAALEIAALVIPIKKYRKGVLMASGIVGMVGLAVLYEAAEHGGELVYSYAGGVGTRSGEPEDLDRLLTAGLYHGAMQDRSNGRSESAARLLEELSRRHPDDPSIQIIAIESLLQDRHEGRVALAALADFAIPPDDRRLRYQHGLLTADAYVAVGQPDSARVTLETLLDDFPDNQRIQDRLAQIR